MCFPALATGHVHLSRFPPLQTVANFPALGSDYTFFFPWHPLHVFTALTAASSSTHQRFPELVLTYTSVWFVALIELLTDQERLLETNFDFGSIFERSRNHKTSWQFPQLHYLFYLTSRETETLNLISQNGRENSFWSSWNSFNNFFQRAYKTWLPGRIPGIRTSCQRWFPWAVQTECTNSLLPLMVLQVPNLGPYKKKIEMLTSLSTMARLGAELTGSSEEIPF